MSFCLIILAGGNSHRFRSKIGKAYQKIGGKSLIEIIDEAIKHNKCNRKKMLEEITLFDKSRKQNYENYLDVKLVDWLKNE